MKNVLIIIIVAVVAAFAGWYCGRHYCHKGETCQKPGATDEPPKDNIEVYYYVTKEDIKGFQEAPKKIEYKLTVEGKPYPDANSDWQELIVGKTIPVTLSKKKADVRIEIKVDGKLADKPLTDDVDLDYGVTAKDEQPDHTHTKKIRNLLREFEIVFETNGPVKTIITGPVKPTAPPSPPN